MDHIVSGYFMYLKAPSDELYEIVEHIDELAHNTPDDAWPIVRRLIEEAPNEDALDYVVAGPLEAILMYHGESYAEIIREEALRSGRMREALSHVILPDIGGNVAAALDEWIHTNDG